MFWDDPWESLFFKLQSFFFFSFGVCRKCFWACAYTPRWLPQLQPSSGSCPLSTETHGLRRRSPLFFPLFSLFPSFLIPFFPTPFLNKLPRTLWLFSSLVFSPFHLLPHLDQGFLVWVSQYSLLHSHGYSLSLDPSVALLHAHWIVFCFCF